MNVLTYWVRSALENIRENRLMTVVSVGSTALALLVIGGVLLLQQNVTELFRQMKSETSVVVFLEDDLTEENRRELQSKLLARAGIRKVTYRSKQEALERVKNQGRGWDVLSELDRNPLPASFHLALSPEQVPEMESLVEEISGWNGVESVQYPRQLIDQLRNVSRVIQLVLLILGVVICLVATFIIFNTIQLAVISREDEIDILKLVGATRRFIGIPYVLGGVVQGAVGCLLGVGFLYGLFWMIRDRLLDLPFLPVQVSFLNPWRLSGLLLLGLGLGVLGSVTAVYRAVRRM